MQKIEIFTGERTGSSNGRNNYGLLIITNKVTFMDEWKNGNKREEKLDGIK